MATQSRNGHNTILSPVEMTADTGAMSEHEFEAAQLVHIGTVFIEERDGKALVRLPNGSKTTVRMSALRPLASAGLHFTRNVEDEGEGVRCLACGWHEVFQSRVEAEDIAITHRSHCPAVTTETAMPHGFRGVGWSAIEVRLRGQEVEIVANADGLLGLARLLELMASRGGDGDATHLTRTMQLSPESLGLTFARKDESLLPSGDPAPLDHPHPGANLSA